jgi:hypothetical protein
MTHDIIDYKNITMLAPNSTASFNFFFTKCFHARNSSGSLVFVKLLLPFHKLQLAISSLRRYRSVCNLLRATATVFPCRRILTQTEPPTQQGEPVANPFFHVLPFICLLRKCRDAMASANKALCGIPLHHALTELKMFAPAA